MEGGNTNEYANIVRQTDEYGNPVQTTLDNVRQGLSTNVGHATGGAGCHYDFGDTTGVGFGAAATYINQLGCNIVKETANYQQQIRQSDHGQEEKEENGNNNNNNKKVTEKIKS